MKQIIKKDTNGSIWRKYYVNHLNQYNGLYIGYWNSGNIWYKRNYLNDKKIGLDYWYNNNNKKLINITYH